MIKGIYIGIDPGSSSGAVAWIIEYEDGSITYDCFRFKNSTEAEIADTFANIMAYQDMCNKQATAVLEKVHSMPGQGVSSTFSFGQNYGLIRGIMIALKISFTQVTPQRWIKLYGFKKAKEQSKTEWKAVLKGQASQMFPNIKMTNDKADALLIAHYCKEINK